MDENYSKDGNVNDYSQSFFSYFSNVESNNNDINNIDNNIEQLLFSKEANKECRDYNHDIFGDNPLKEIPKDSIGQSLMQQKRQLKQKQKQKQTQTQNGKNGKNDKSTKKNNNNNNNDNDNIMDDNNYGLIHVLSKKSGASVLFELYGIFSFHGGLIRTQSKYLNKHIVLIPKDNSDNSETIDDNIKRAIESLGINVIQFDPTEIRSNTPGTIQFKVSLTVPLFVFVCFVQG